MHAYYNENDPFCAQWLKNLIDANFITKGDVDARSVLDVKPDDLKSYTRCHFFAGIAGWDLALQLADFPADREVWTGSCPCQPFSAAGKAGGFADERHLWPYWFHLIAQQRPDTIFGEQVASKAGVEWLALVHADMEVAGYAFASADLGAACVGAPHIRQRLWFVADALPTGWSEGRTIAGDRSAASIRGNGLAHNDSTRLEERSSERGDAQPQCASVERDCDAGELGDAACNGERQSRLAETSERRSGEIGRSSPWSNLQWLPCTDGKARPTQPGIQPLAHGVSARVGKLRAAGNAIVPQVAAAFVEVAMQYAP